MSFDKEYILETKETSEQTNINEIFYNCTECSSSIEIISLDEKGSTIEFQCISKNHKKKMSIKEYITKMKNFNNIIINNDTCKIHDNKYECYCLDCNTHLCKECLKLRKHINHVKNNIIEIQPNKKELVIIKNIINYYKDKANNLENEKIKKRKELNKKLNELKNKLKEKKDLKLKENKNKMELELKLNSDNYINDIKIILNKIETELKLRKYEYNFQKDKINNKYKSINEKDNIIYKNNLEKIDMKYIKEIQKFKYDKNIEDLNYIKRLIEIIYETYNEYNNNYFNSININNILMAFHDNEIYSNGDLNDVYENLIKYKTPKIKNNSNNYSTNSKLIEVGKIKYIIDEYEYKLSNLKNDYENKIREMNIEYNKNISYLENEIKSKIIKKKCDNGIYEGESKFGKKDGKGFFQWNDGEIYFGDWKNDKREGKGKYCWNDGDVYYGDWINDNKEGKGIYSFNSGNRYEGDFKNNKREGKGILYYKNGSIYEGDFKNNKREGKGILYHINGDREMGDYINNKQVGKHVILTVNGEVKTHIYNNK